VGGWVGETKNGLIAAAEGALYKLTSEKAPWGESNYITVLKGITMSSGWVTKSNKIIAQFVQQLQLTLSRTLYKGKHVASKITIFTQTHKTLAVHTCPMVQITDLLNCFITDHFGFYDLHKRNNLILLPVGNAVVNKYILLFY